MKKSFNKSLMAVAAFLIAFFLNFTIDINLSRNDDSLSSANSISSVSAKTDAVSGISFTISENTADAASRIEKKLKKEKNRIKNRAENKFVHEIGDHINDAIQDSIDAYVDSDSSEFKYRKAKEAFWQLDYGDQEVTFTDSRVRNAFKRIVKDDPYTTIISNLYEEGITYKDSRGRLKTKRGPLVGFVVRKSRPGQVHYIRGR